LAQFGANREHQRGKPSIVYGVLTDRDGWPSTVEVSRGNTADPATIPDHVTKLRTRFRLERVVLVGDRGTRTQTPIDSLKHYPGLGWIAAWRFEAIRTRVDARTLDPSLLAHQPLAAMTSSRLPGARLVACDTPRVAEERRRKRTALREATAAALAPIARDVARRTKKPVAKVEIGQSVGRVMHHHQATRVRAPIFLCVLAYDVEWPMRKALAPLLCDDEELADNRPLRDPRAPAQPSAAAQQKKTIRPDRRGMAYPQLQYACGRAWDALSQPMSRHI
jgi:hypothetical protein